MSTTYNFIKNEVNHTQLKEEINLKEGIPCPAIGSNMNGTTLYVEMKESLSVEAQAILTQVVADHIAKIVTENDIQAVKIMEEPTRAKIDRTIQTKSIELAQGASLKSFSFPYPIVLLGGEFHCKQENVKDRCQMVVNPDGVVGVTTGVISSGVTEITLPEAVLPYAFRGYTIKLTDGTNTDDLGEVISMSNANPFTVTNATTREWAAGTMIIIEYYVIPHIYFDAVATYGVGKNSSSGTLIEANTPIEFRYFHENGITKDVLISFIMEYYF